jgi:hypothetical protein
MQELLLSLNGFCFSTRRKWFIWLLVFLMSFEFQFVLLVVNIVFFNFGILFFQGLLNYTFGKGWTFFFKHPHSHPHWDDISFSVNSQRIKRFDQYFNSFLIYNHTHIVVTLTWPSVGVKPNTWKSWGFGVLRDSRMFRARQQDPKHLALGCSWCHWKGLEA